MNVTNCIFCDVPLAPSQANLPTSRTEEHVYASWIRDSVVNNRIKMFTATVGLPSPPILHRHPPLERLVNSAVCRACNNGWMSDLENAVDPLMRQLFSGADIRLFSPTEIESFARWTAKTVTVMSYVTPQMARVPRRSSLSLHPISPIAPQMRFFYCSFTADMTLEGGYLQLVHSSELNIIGSEEISGTRMTLCLNNHCFTVDFPPIVQGIEYDLSKSCSAQLWPVVVPAGTSSLQIPTPALISDVLYTICSQIGVRLNTCALAP